MRILLEDLNNGGHILLFTSNEDGILVEQESGLPELNTDHQHVKGWHYARNVRGAVYEYPSGPFNQIGDAVRDAVACNWASNKEMTEWLLGKHGGNI